MMPLARANPYTKNNYMCKKKIPFCLGIVAVILKGIEEGTLISKTISRVYPWHCIHRMHKLVKECISLIGKKL